MSEVRANVQLALLFAAGLVAGIWVFVSPWVLDYPNGAGGSWTTSTWSAVWVGAIVVAGSAIGVLTVLALALHEALKQRRRDRAVQARSG